MWRTEGGTIYLCRFICHVLKQNKNENNSYMQYLGFQNPSGTFVRLTNSDDQTSIYNYGVAARDGNPNPPIFWPDCHPW